MKNLKYIIGFAIFGFLLSLIIAVTHHVSAGPALGRALISAVIFGVLATAITFLLGQFLSGDYSTPADSDTPTTKKKSNTSSHAVDLYIEDEDLPSQSDEATFVVGTSHQMLMPSDVNPDSPYGKSVENNKKKKPKPSNNTATNKATPATAKQNTIATPSVSNATQPAANSDANFTPPDVAPPKPNDFTPITLGSGKNGTSRDIEKAIKSDAAKKDGGDELDVLPDLNSLEAATSNIEVPTQGADRDINSTLSDDLTDKSSDAYIGGSSNFAKSGTVPPTPGESSGNPTQQSANNSANTANSAGHNQTATAKKDANAVTDSPKVNNSSLATPAKSPDAKNSTITQEKSPATNPRGNKVDDDTSLAESYSGVDDDDDLSSMETSDGGETDDSDSEGAASDGEYLPSANHLEASQVVEGKDVDLMAKAISTLLLRDKG